MSAFDRQTDDDTPAAALQRGFERADEVFGLLVDIDFTVAQHAEQAMRCQLQRLGEYLVEEHQDEMFQLDEARFGSGHANEAVQLVRQRDHRVERLRLLRIAELQDQRHATVGDEGEGVGGVHGDGGQDGEYLAQETRFRPGAVLFGQFRRVDDRDARLPQLGAQVLEAALLRLVQLGDRLIDQAELLLRQQVVGGDGLDARPDLSLERRHAHHDELVQIAGGDRQEAQPFQQGMLGIVRFAQHPVVEGEPGNFAIDEAVRRKFERDGGRPILFLRSLLRLDRLLGGFRGSAHPNSPPFRRLAAQHAATFKAGAWNFC